MSSIGAIVAVIYGQEEINLIDFFRKKKALSPSTAIEFNREEFEKSGNFLAKPTTINLSKLPFLKLVKSNIYYLDEIELEKVYKIRRRVGIIILLILILTIITGFVLIFFRTKAL